jgi:hypothetical protein
MEEHLERFDSCVLSQVSLESLGVSIGQPLDIDDVKRPRDLSTRFFQPWVPDGLLEEATAYCSLIWMDRLRSRYNPCEWEYGDNKARWFHACLKELYSMDPELWEPWQVDSYQIKTHTGLDLPYYQTRDFNPLSGTYREYLPEAAFFPVDETKPHVACFTNDSSDAPGDAVLRSEVHYAIELVKFRLEGGRHTNHHTKPGMIYTLERDQFARITQVYFDGKTNKLVLRQSRQLDLRGPEPTDDAYLLVRWMANRPVGETEYVDETEPKDETMSTDSSGTAPKLLLGCA